MSLYPWDEALFRMGLNKAPITVTVAACDYTCYTPHPDRDDSYIATRADSSYLFVVTPMGGQAEPLQAIANCGPALWPVPASDLLARVCAHQAADVAHAVNIHFAAKLILPLPFTTELVTLLEQDDSTQATHLRMLLYAYGQGDTAGSPRLQKACAEALAHLAAG